MEVRFKMFITVIRVKSTMKEDYDSRIREIISKYENELNITRYDSCCMSNTISHNMTH